MIFIHTSYQVGFDTRLFQCGDRAQIVTHVWQVQKSLVPQAPSDKLSPAKRVLPGDEPPGPGANKTKRASAKGIYACLRFTSPKGEVQCEFLFVNDSSHLVRMPDGLTRGKWVGPVIYKMKLCNILWSIGTCVLIFIVLIIDLVWISEMNCYPYIFRLLSSPSLFWSLHF